MKRKTLSKRIRFEVFKRDSFKCQYCGASAPEVLLNVDHIQPVAKGGESDIANLITSCVDCNSGKSDKTISDTAAVSKRKAQLDQLQERREQLEMIAEWQSGLINLDAQALQLAESLWSEIAHGFSLTDHGRTALRKTIKRFGLTETLESMRRSAYYLDSGPDGKLLPESVNLAFDKVPGVCVVRKREREDPVLAELHHIVSASDKRLYGECTRWQVISDMKAAISAGASVEQLWELARACTSWWEFKRELRAFTGDGRG